MSEPEPVLGWLGLIGTLDRLVGNPSSVEGLAPGYAAAMGSAGEQVGAGRWGDE